MFSKEHHFTLAYIPIYSLWANPARLCQFYEELTCVLNRYSGFEFHLKNADVAYDADNDDCILLLGDPETWEWQQFSSVWKDVENLTLRFQVSGTEWTRAHMRVHYPDQCCLDRHVLAQT